MFFKTMNNNMSNMYCTKIMLLALKTVLKVSLFQIFVGADFWES